MEDTPAAVIDLFLLSETPSAEVIEQIQNYALWQRDELFQMIAATVRAHPGVYTTQGVVSQQQSYSFIKMEDNNIYINRIAALVNLIESAFGYKRVLDHKKPSPDLLDMAVYPPPSPCGTHVTIGEKITNKTFLGKKVNFKISRFRYWNDARMGSKASPFENKTFILMWYGLDVEEMIVDGNIIQLKDLNPSARHGAPHISVAVMAYKKV